MGGNLGASRRAATDLDMWGTELQPVCAPACAPQAVCHAGNSCECSLGYEGDGRTCTGEQAGEDMRGVGDPIPLLSPGPTTLSLPQWRTCVRMGMAAAVSMPPAAR